MSAHLPNEEAFSSLARFLSNASRQRGTLIVAVLLLGGLLEMASAAPLRRKYDRPAVAFTPATFTITYGKTKTLCATVTPARMASQFSSASAWGNSAAAPGVFTITPGTDASCTGPGKIFLTVLSKLTTCSGQGSVVAKFTSPPPESKLRVAGAAQGTVSLPKSSAATLKINEGCPGGFGAQKTYYVRLASDAGTSPDFNGLSVNENLDTINQPNTCDFNTNFPQSWTIGTQSDETPAPQNSFDDGNGKCGFDSTDSCSSIINQSFTVGSCTTTPITINFTMTNGVGTITRSDSGGQ